MQIFTKNFWRLRKTRSRGPLPRHSLFLRRGGLADECRPKRITTFTLLQKLLTHAPEFLSCSKSYCGGACLQKILRSLGRRKFKKDYMLCRTRYEASRYGGLGAKRASLASLARTFASGPTFAGRTANRLSPATEHVRSSRSRLGSSLQSPLSGLASQKLDCNPQTYGHGSRIVL